MSEYIERDAALNAIEEMQRGLCPVGRFGRSFVYGKDRETFDAWKEIADKIEFGIPAADVAPVVHGRWVPPAVGKYGCLCSACKKQSDNGYDYCPNCGAMMDKEDK